MNFIVMTDEQAYTAADELQNRTQQDVDTTRIYEGDHPIHGRIQIIVPAMGRSIVFGDAFRAVPTVLKLVA